MNLKANAVLHNKFEVRVCDKETGEVKQKAYGYNVITDGFFKVKLNQYTNSDYPRTTYNMGYIGVGKGTGTPAIEDTGLFSSLLFRSATVIEEHYEYPTSYVTKQIKINADELNGETFTEVGLAFRYTYGLWSTEAFIIGTHAMLQDAEGNQIAISKTDVDVVYINATFYCTFSCTGFGDRGIYPTPDKNGLIKWILLGSTDLKVATNRFPLANASDLTTQYDFVKSFTFSNGVGNMETLTFDLPVMTILDTEFNLHVVKNIGIPTIGAFQFPDPSVFPDYVVSHLVLGEGDGETTEFSVKAPLIKPGSERVYVGGRELTAQEYTIDYESNCVNARENYYTANMKVDGVHAIIGDMATRSPSTSYRYMDPMYWGIWPESGYSYPSSATVSQAKPIWIDLGEELACNRLRIETSAISTSQLPKFVIEYSHDNETWDPITYTLEEVSSTLRLYTWKFPMTTARYWRCYIPGYNWSYPFYYANNGTGTRDNTTHIKSTLFLGKSVPGLTLKEAPQVGQTVEISYKLDTPYKTENNILRLTCSIRLQRG